MSPKINQPKLFYIIKNKCLQQFDFWNKQIKSQVDKHKDRQKEVQQSDICDQLHKLSEMTNTCRQRVFFTGLQGIVQQKSNLPPSFLIFFFSTKVKYQNTTPTRHMINVIHLHLIKIFRKTLRMSSIVL